MDAPTYNPWRADVQVDPYPTYRALRSADPVHFHPYARIWFVTRHRDCVTVLRDARFSARLGQELRTRSESLPESMLTADAPEHARLRGPAHGLFAPSALLALRPWLAGLVRRLLDELEARGGGDVIEDLAVPLALEVLGDLVGVPEADRGRFAALTVAASVNLDPLAPPEAQAQATKAAHELDRYIADASAAVPEGEHDLVGRLLRSERRRAALTEDEIAGIGTLMVIGSYEPMVHLIGNGVLALLRCPAELERVRASDGDGLTRGGVEELLRFDSPVQFAARGALADVDVGGVTIERGQAVVVLLGAANRDPDVFEDPDRLDLGRRPNPHLAFGAGAHTCLGAPLARLVACEATGALLRRFPDLELAGEPIRRASQVPRGLSVLPVRV